MKKAAVWIGGGAAALAVAYWLGRRKSQEMHGWLPAWATSTESVSKIAAAARRQVAAAQAGRRLSDYRKAEDVGLFWSTATSVTVAELKTAYWLAVASRVSGSQALASRASKSFSRGLALVPMPAKTDPAAVAAVYQKAVAALGSPKNPQVRGVLAALGHQGERKTIASRQRTEEESHALTNTAKATGGDMLKGATTMGNYIRAFLGLDNPLGTAYPWYMRWGTRIAVGAGALLVMRVAFGSEYRALKTVVVDAHGKVKGILAPTAAGAPG